MDERSPALKTDLYEITMAAGYFKNKVNLRATFELFCHQSPPERSYFISCGLEQAVDYLLSLRFSPEDINALKKLPVLKSLGKDFFDYLSKFRFTGDLWAMPEGSPFFPLEPVIQVKAPIIEAQIVETYLLSIINIESLVATKASRVVRAAAADGKSRQVIDFGCRRAHGPEAGVLAARAAFIGGCAGTSNVFAGLKFGIPVYGTMAHSWVQAFGDEEEAFRKYNSIFPGNTVFLIDTFDTLKAAETVARLKKDVLGVRLDSGDLGILSRKVREILDRSGLKRVKIIASGNLNEYKILRLVKAGAPIDFFGVGTEMVTSADLPSLDLVYKLVETESPDKIVSYRTKRSEGKRTLPGRKQVYRSYTAKGIYSGDTICLADEDPPGSGKAMLEQVIKNGKLVKKLPDTGKIREYALKENGRLPDKCADIVSGKYLRVELSRKLKTLNTGRNNGY